MIRSFVIFGLLFLVSCEHETQKESVVIEELTPRFDWTGNLHFILSTKKNRLKNHRTGWSKDNCHNGRNVCLNHRAGGYSIRICLKGVLQERCRLDDFQKRCFFHWKFCEEDLPQE